MPVPLLPCFNRWRCGCRLTFRVGPEPLNSFRMVERHYFKDKLMRSYDFNFGFVIP